jgi:hypothetical protein
MGRVDMRAPENTLDALDASTKFQKEYKTRKEGVREAGKKEAGKWV